MDYFKWLTLTMPKTMLHADHATVYQPYYVVLQFIGKCYSKSALQFIVQIAILEELLQQQRKDRIYKICLFFCPFQMSYADLFPSTVIQSMQILLPVTSRVKYIAIPIIYMYDYVKDGTISLHKIDTKLNLADSGTKPNPAPTHFQHFDQAIGVHFYPPADLEHYKLLNLDSFKVSSPYTKKADKATSSQG
eukprot:scaffold133488_cov39-Cyclotella_meneghiniana.AAC.5